MRPIAKQLTLVLIILSITAGAFSSATAAPAALNPIKVLTGASSRVDEDSYWELVQRSHSVVQRLNGLSEQEIKLALAELADEWEVLKEVQFEDGQTISIDNGYLLENLRAAQPELEKINGMLNALLAAHEQYPRRVFSTADLASLHDILAQPEFLWPEPAANPVGEWFQKMMGRFLNWLNSILGNVSIGVFQVNLFSIITFLLLVVVIFFVFRMVFADFIKEVQLKDEDNNREDVLTSQAAFEKAQSLSRGGDFRSAVRYLYLSSLLVLDERGLLRYDRSKTNREYLRSISNSPGLAQPLEEVIEVFDNVWYGYHTLEEDTFKHYSDRVRELKEKKG